MPQKRNRLGLHFYVAHPFGGILTFRTGFPLTLRASDNSNTTSRGARASVAGTGGKTLGNVGLGTDWFDTAAYAIPARGTLGTAGNGTERGPGD